VRGAAVCGGAVLPAARGWQVWKRQRAAGSRRLAGKRLFAVDRHGRLLLCPQLVVGDCGPLQARGGFRALVACCPPAQQDGCNSLRRGDGPEKVPNGVLVRAHPQPVLLLHPVELFSDARDAILAPPRPRIKRARRLGVCGLPALELGDARLELSDARPCARKLRAVLSFIRAPERGWHMLLQELD
jgi:hypothetical protein